jgi:hypothetical protein
MPNTKELLDMAIKAHGGIEKWHSISEITARIRTGGILFKSKFVSSSLNRIEIRVSTNRPYASITPFPSRGYRGIFDMDAVYIESDTGERVCERSEPRTCFKGFRHNIWWDYLDALYFVGYASFNYLCTPFIFLLPGFGVDEMEPWTE